MDLLPTLLLKGGQQATALNGAPQAAQTGQLVEPEPSSNQPFQAVLEKAQKGDLQEAELALVAQNNSGMLAGLLALSQIQQPIEMVPVQGLEGTVEPPAAAGTGQATGQTSQGAQMFVMGAGMQVAATATMVPEEQQQTGPATTPYAAISGSPMPPVVDGQTQPPLPETKQEDIPPQPDPEVEVNGKAMVGPQTLPGGKPTVILPPQAGNAAWMPIGDESPDVSDNTFPVQPPATEPALPPPPTDGGTPPVSGGDSSSTGDSGIGTPPPSTEPGIPAPPSGDVTPPPVTEDGVQPPSGEAAPGTPGADDNPGGQVRLGPPVPDENMPDEKAELPGKNRQVGPPVVNPEPGDARLNFPTDEMAQTSENLGRDENPGTNTAGGLNFRSARDANPDTAAVSSPPTMAPPETGAAGYVQQAADGSAVKPELARLAEAHQPEVLNQITRNLENLVRSGQGSFHLQLEPQDLGKIDLRFVNRADGLHVVMAANLPETGAMLERNLMDLRHSLSQMGVQVGDLSVSYGQPQAHGQAFAEQHGQASGRGAYRWSSPADQETSPEVAVELPRFKTSRIDYLA